MVRWTRIAISIICGAFLASDGLVLALEKPRFASGAKALIPQWMESAEIPGMSLALVEGGRIALLEARGVRDVSTADPVGPETVFQAASLSKPVFAYLVFRLFEEGLLDLDVPLAEYLPNSRLDHDERYRKITARMTLSHSSGLPNWGGTPLQIDFEPGERFQYSGEGYVYLQQVVEKRAGESLEALARRHVFGPLGMSHSSYVWQESFESTAAAGHDRHGRSRPQSKQDANAAASLYTTASDYARFVAALMSGTGLSEESRKEMLRPQVAARGWGGGPAEAQERIFWALGWGIQKDQAGDIFWHWGDQGIYRCLVAMDLSSEKAFVYFTNSNNGLAIGADWLENLGKEPWAMEFLGYDQHASPRFQIRKTVEKAYLEYGGETGLRRFKELRALHPDVVDERFAARLGRFLMEEDLTADAVDLFRLNAETHRESADAYGDVAEAIMTAGRFWEALAACKEALRLEPESESLRRKAAWMEDLAIRSDDPKEIDEAELARLAGEYGPRLVRLREGRLYYQRQGNREYRLLPLDDSTFLLDGLPTFRIRFAQDPGGAATKLIGLYFNGNQDENLKTR